MLQARKGQPLTSYPYFSALTDKPALDNSLISTLFAAQRDRPHFERQMNSIYLILALLYKNIVQLINMQKTQQDLTYIQTNNQAPQTTLEYTPTNTQRNPTQRQSFIPNEYGVNPKQTAPDFSTSTQRNTTQRQSFFSTKYRVNPMQTTTYYQFYRYETTRRIMEQQRAAARENEDVLFNEIRDRVRKATAQHDAHLSKDASATTFDNEKVTQQPPINTDQQRVDGIYNAARGAEKEVTSKVTDKLVTHIEKTNPGIFEKLEDAYRQKHGDSFVSKHELAQFAMENYKDDEFRTSTYDSDPGINILLNDAEKAIDDSNRRIQQRTKEELDELIAERPEAAKTIVEMFPDHDASKFHLEMQEARENGQVIQGEVVKEDDARNTVQEKVDNEPAKQETEANVNTENTVTQNQKVIQGEVIPSKTVAEPQVNTDNQSPKVIQGVVIPSQPVAEPQVNTDTQNQNVIQGVVIPSKTVTEPQVNTDTQNPKVIQGEVIPSKTVAEPLVNTDNQNPKVIQGVVIPSQTVGLDPNRRSKMQAMLQSAATIDRPDNTAWATEKPRENVKVEEEIGAR